MSLPVLRMLACAPVTLVLLLAVWASPSAGDFPSGTLAAHGPIFIDGNADLTANNGVTGGFGTALDPYVIEGWDINASQRIGLVIQNTDAHVVVRNVTVHFGGIAEIGMRLYNVKNMALDRVRSVQNSVGIEAAAVDGGLTIENSYFEGNGIGIRLWGTTGIVVRNNRFVGDGIAFIGNASAHFASHDVAGNMVNGRPLLYFAHCADVTIDAVTVGQLVVADCSRVSISRLLVSDTDVGIVLAFANDVALRQNTVTGTRGVSGTDVGIGASFVRNVTIENNVISDVDYGIYFDGPSVLVALRQNEFTGNTRGVYGWLSDFRIERNVLTGNWKGLELVAPSQGLVSRNTALDNEYGIDLGWGHDVIVADNQARGNGKAVSLLLAANVTVVYNNLTAGHGYGILATESENVTVAGNEIRDNPYGVYLSGARRSWIYHNNFIRNEVQAVDKVGGNHWDAGYPGGGNYWSNYTGTDRCRGPRQDACPDPDGIGDVPVQIVNRTQDRYPLMDAQPLPEGVTPLIAHSAPSVLAPGDVATIDVFVASPRGVDRVFLHYREIGQDAFETVELAYLGGSHYGGTITAPGHVGVIEYYIEVRDREGNVTLSPLTGKFRILVEYTSASNLPLLVAGVLAASGGAIAAGCFLLKVRRRKRPAKIPSEKKL